MRWVTSSYLWTDEKNLCGLDFTTTFMSFVVLCRDVKRQIKPHVRYVTILCSSCKLIDIAELDEFKNKYLNYFIKMVFNGLYWGA